MIRGLAAVSSIRQDVFDAAAPGATTKLMIVILGMLTAFGPVAVDLYLPAFPNIARDLHTDAGAVQRTLSVFFVGMAIGQLVHGPLSDRFGRRPPLLFGSGIFFLASIGCALAPTIEVFTLMRLLQALGACAGVVVARAVVRDRFPPHETARIFSVLMLILGVSPILAPLFGGYILHFTGWRSMFWMLACYGALMFAAVSLRLPESRSHKTATLAREEGPINSYRALISNPHVMGFVLIGAFAGAALPTYVSSSPSVMIDGFHVSPQMFGWFFAMNGIALISGSQVNLFLTRRYSADQIIKIANRLTLAAALVMTLCAFTKLGGMWGIVIPVFVIFGTLGVNQPNALSGALSHDPHRAGATSALVGALQGAIGAGASVIASAFLDGTPRPMSIAMTTSIGIAVILFTLFRPKGARLPPRSEAAQEIPPLANVD
jgi:DHA1 family bicyclomycin/chloramphenicol resistance-like MFS transporter